MSRSVLWGLRKAALTILFSIFYMPAVSWSADSDKVQIPDSFRNYTASSELSVNYDDLTSVLKRTVLVTGRSTREKAERSTASTGTRMKAQKKVLTALEGNRFFYEIFKEEENRIWLTKIRKSLETLPSEAPLDLFNRREQLAYWLNLYQVALLEQLTADPDRKLKDKVVGRKAVFNKKILDVAGVPLSLNDIQYKILAVNYADQPLVIYGLHQGYIGSPNIRKAAYTGKYVYEDLEKNAREFINSNRGTYSTDVKKFRVSSFYKRNKVFFPDFEQDLKRHLYQFISPSYEHKLDRAGKIEADIDDWTIVSLTGNSRAYAGSVATSRAAMLDAVVSGGPGSGITSESGLGGSHLADGMAMNNNMESSLRAYGRFDPAEFEILMQLNKKRMESTGSVTVEEVDKSELSKSKEKEGDK
ncbi:DUF547 domain-containing protein [Emcibacter sp.]|uniref:DUF547 domain-containing protein n=1 Tax=Emcibacter sp. TaxID=1979954 RepID=UPI002AA8CE88|nr:DUF547 domain-containing protein [Emcibacter sp.]